MLRSTIVLFLYMILSTVIAEDVDNPYLMSFDELAQITVVESASLTQTSIEKSPSSVTVITREMIENSGARSMNELFSIFIPGVHFAARESNSALIFNRGDNLFSQRYITLVNGRVMDSSVFSTASTERFISTLGDVDRIEFIRGPGAALYGPGAQSGVINIITLNGETFQGTDVKVRQGFTERFSNFEFRTGHKINESENIFFYYGMDYYKGANPDDSPLYQAFSFNGARAGERLDDGVGNYQAAYRELPRHKLHLEYHVEDLEIWFRYLREGTNSTEQFVNEDRDSRAVTGSGFQQLTLHAKYSKELTDTLNWHLELGYDSLGLTRIRRLKGDPDRTRREGREDHYRVKNTLLWTAGDHQLAFGNEIFRKKVGNDTLNNSYGNLGPGNSTESFYTTDYSFFAEHQWQFSESWTSFVGGHVNKHSYTDYVYSPKLALVYNENDWNVKFIFNRSSRSNREFELRDDWLGWG